MKYLKLRLCGVMQHYSAQNTLVTSSSKTYYRTERFPTRNAVAGIIGSALGLPRKGRELRDMKEILEMKYKTNKSGGVMKDFQIAKPRKGDNFHTVNGKLRSGGTGISKTIEYLYDYDFDVFVGGDEELLNKIAKALANPVYSPYLGKRCCFPSYPILSSYQLINEEDLGDVYDCA